VETAEEQTLLDPFTVLTTVRATLAASLRVRNQRSVASPSDRVRHLKASELGEASDAVRLRTGWPEEEFLDLLSCEHPEVKKWGDLSVEDLDHSIRVVTVIRDLIDATSAAADELHMQRICDMGGPEFRLVAATEPEVTAELGRTVAAREVTLWAVELLGRARGDVDLAMRVVGDDGYFASLIAGNRYGTARFVMRQRMKLYREDSLYRERLRDEVAAAQERRLATSRPANKRGRENRANSKRESGTFDQTVRRLAEALHLSRRRQISEPEESPLS
jgi:hypothetical protein